MDQYVICVDPESQQIYTLNTHTNEIIIETDVLAEYRLKASIQIQNLTKILACNNQNQYYFDGSQDAMNYRRRKLPFHLLKGI